MWKWTKRIGLGLICLIAVLLLSGAAYQFISTKIDEGAYPPPGKLVDIGGYRLHINCSGEGGPTVVFDAGMGCNSLDWALVQPEVAKFTRVCSYDRAGNGWSDESPLERTSQNIVDELHDLLKNSGEKGPYILVGHSFGGPNVRLYASKYPEEVFGMVLVDSSHEDQLQEMPDWPQSFLQRLLIHPDVAPFLTSIGLTRLFIHLPQSRDAVKMFSPNIQETYLSTMSTTKNIRTFTQEFEKFEQSLKQLKNAGGLLGDKPLIVITAGKSLTSEETGYPKDFTDKLATVWETLQKDLVTKSTKGQRIIAEHSGHMITREQPEIIIEAIREVVGK
jgi:pimeloyl-ACP methyl ester carboxylesterase